jgi:hypothetical protein
LEKSFNSKLYLISFFGFGIFQVGGKKLATVFTSTDSIVNEFCLIKISSYPELTNCNRKFEKEKSKL